MFDQSAKADKGKLPLTLVPTAAIRAIARIRQYGVEKYKDPDNYKRVEVERYRDAAYRHWLKYLDDPHGVDEESGLPHLWHCITNLAFLCELDEVKRMNDNVLRSVLKSMADIEFGDSLISKQDAIDIVKRAFDDVAGPHHNKRYEINSKLAALPKVGVNWIPVTECLPEELKEVICSYESGFVATALMHMEEETPIWLDAVTDAPMEPVAWMPFPEPYKGE